MANIIFYKLQFSVLNLKGKDVSSFLNGVSSNDLESSCNAFLNQHGRIIATFFQQKLSSEEFLIAVPSFLLETVQKHLAPYAKLNRVAVGLTAMNAYMDLETTQIIYSNGEHPQGIEEEAFKLYRLKHFIPLLGIDYQPHEFILNVHEKLFVSYTKGCYLGQEPVAKVYHRAKPTRKLIVVKEDECAPEDKVRMTSKAVDPMGGCIKGFVFVNNH